MSLSGEVRGADSKAKEERDLEAAEQVDVPALKILAHGSDGLRNRDLNE